MRVELLGGEDTRDAFTRIKEISKEHGCSVSFNFNGVRMLIDERYPESVDTLEHYYNKMLHQKD